MKYGTKKWTSFKKGITVLNSPGTIDADYRGEIGVLLVNLSSEPFIIEDGNELPNWFWRHTKKHNG